MADHPRTVEEVYRDFAGRRNGLIKALTTDFEEFFNQCDPEKENLFLYGYLNGNWEVSLPANLVPTEIPEPTLGINFDRDRMQSNDWRSLVAAYSDSWLFSVAFCFAARLCFQKYERERLFSVMNGLPTVSDVVSGILEKKSKEETFVSEAGSSKSAKYSGTMLASEEDGGLEEEEDEDALCGACGEKDTEDGFWICCDACERWFHGKCVKITRAKAKHIAHYNCPTCNLKPLKQHMVDR